MNNKIISIPIIGLAVLLRFGNLFSQDLPLNELPPVTITAKTSKAQINNKITNAFNYYFKGATNEKWRMVEKKFMVNFLHNEQKKAALFSKKGQLVYHVIFGSEQNLPGEVKQMINNTYENLNITRVYNVKQKTRDIWVVSIEDYDTQVMVKVENNEMQETKRFQKTG